MTSYVQIVAGLFLKLIDVYVFDKFSKYTPRARKKNQFTNSLHCKPFKAHLTHLA